MIYRAMRLFCDQEHGCGDVCFPDDANAINFVEPMTARQLRRVAKGAGWSRTRTNDYCPMCTDSEKERER